MKNYKTRAIDIKTLTNANRIRAMTDEELADFIGVVDCLDCPLNSGDEWCSGKEKSCKENVLTWLKSPVTSMPQPPSTKE